jgi:phospholipid-transporting ATPase
VTAVKEAIEDLARRKRDSVVNARLALVLGPDGKETPTRWDELLVGQVVVLRGGSEVPADCVLLAASNPLNSAFVETANLDGETNLKSRSGVPGAAGSYMDEAVATEGVRLLERDEGSELGYRATAAAHKLADSLAAYEVHAESPNPKLYEFTGSLEHSTTGDVLPVGPDSILLRGSALKNTGSALAVIVYSGDQTKLLLNSKDAPLKRSNVERVTNKFIYGLLVVEVTMSAAAAAGLSLFASSPSAGAYLGDVSSEQGTTAFFLGWITFIILFNNLIPISLYVSLELAKVGQAILIDSDRRLYYDRKDTPALARTSNLNEELGQVQYVFSDKTGTLTANLMQFRRAVVGGVSYGSEEGAVVPGVEADEFVNCSDPALLELARSTSQSDLVRHYFTLLAVCHTVVPESKADPLDGEAGAASTRGDDNQLDADSDFANLEYRASSPDERALVCFAAAYGYRFVARDLSSLTVYQRGSRRRWELLHTLEFTSDRKRQSVVVRDDSGDIFLYCKGADNVILERLCEPGSGDADDDAASRKATQTSLDACASEGLRTLLCAYRPISAKEYKAWEEKHAEAAASLDDRAGKVAESAARLERDLILCGATAIEDRLQDGVPDAISLLRDSGIAVWVLTGDKRQTAIEIAHSAALFDESTTVHILQIDGEPDAQRRFDMLTEQMEKVEGVLDALSSDKDFIHNHALVIDGAALAVALSPKLEKRFALLGVRCYAVVACRVSPAQKADVVTLIRRFRGAIGLAIGDGANDVSMIRAAHVGVGISGEEGLQAARASDYSIAQFRFLPLLLLLHGRPAYRRISLLILYSFYKNVVLQLTQLWFASQSGWSGQTLYERWTLAAYNAFFTSLPIIAFAIFDKDVSDDAILAHPALYREGIDGHHFRARKFFGWLANAFWHSIVVYIIPITSLAGGIAAGAVVSNGRVLGLYEQGLGVYTAALATVTLKLALETRLWNVWTHVTMWGSLFVLWGAWCGIYQLVGMTPLGLGRDFVYSSSMAASSPIFWLSVVVATVAALYRDIAWKAWQRYVLPRPVHIVQELQEMSSSLRHESSTRGTQTAADATRSGPVLLDVEAPSATNTTKSSRKSSGRPSEDFGSSSGRKARSRRRKSRRVSSKASEDDEIVLGGPI